MTDPRREETVADRLRDAGREPARGDGRSGPTAGADGGATPDGGRGSHRLGAWAARIGPAHGATMAFATTFELGSVLLPALLIGTLGATPALLAVVEGVGIGLGSLARLAGGALVHDPRRRRAIGIGGYAVGAALTSLLAAAAATWQVATLRAGTWVAQGLRAPATAVAIAEEAPARRVGRAFGAERAADYLGAALGAAAAVVLVALLSPRAALLCALVPGTLAVLAALRELRPHPAPRVPRRTWAAARRLARGNLRFTFAGIAAVEAANISFTLLILRATKLLEEERGLTSAVVVALTLFVGYRLAAAAAGLLGGRALDGLGARGVLSAGSVALLAAYVLFAETSGGVASLALAFVLAGTGLGLIETAEQAAVARRAAPDDRALAFGVLTALQSAGRVVASVAAGVLWTLVAPAAGLLITAPLLIVGPMILFTAVEAEEHGLERRAGRRRRGG
jgi:MFS family permease